MICQSPGISTSLAETMLLPLPLPYAVAVILLTALFLLSFSISRDPRSWRRLYQARFMRREDFSVNRNKRIDESVKHYGIVIAMVFLVLAVACFVLGLTSRRRSVKPEQTMEERFRSEDVDKVRAGFSGGHHG